MNEDLRKRLSRVDLNLLPVLLVLMETQSTQATADRIGRTQSAVSHALARLRDMLNDDLFVRHGPRLVPTKLLLDMQGPLTEILHSAALLVERGRVFDPETSDRTVVIGCPDLALPLAETFCDALAASAPHIRFRITGYRKGNTRLRAGEIDALISLYRNKPEAGQSLTTLASLGWAYYTAQSAAARPDGAAAHWARRRHVQVHTGAGGRTPIDDAAKLAGITREVGLQVENFFEALYVTTRGQMCFSTFPGLVHPVAEKLGLVRHSLPFAVPDAPLCLVTRSTGFEPFSQWVHETCVAAAGRFFAALPPSVEVKPALG